MGWVFNATPRPQKLTVTYLLKKLPTYLAKQNFLTVFAIVRSHPHPEPGNPNPYHRILFLYDTQNHAALRTAIDSQISFLAKPLSCTAQSTVLYLNHSKHFYRFKSTGWFRSKGQYFGRRYYRSLWGKVFIWTCV